MLSTQTSFERPHNPINTTQHNTTLNTHHTSSLFLLCSLLQNCHHFLLTPPPHTHRTKSREQGRKEKKHTEEATRCWVCHAVLGSRLAQRAEVRTTGFPSGADSNCDLQGTTSCVTFIYSMQYCYRIHISERSFPFHMMGWNEGKKD